MLGPERFDGNPPQKADFSKRHCRQDEAGQVVERWRPVPRQKPRAQIGKSSSGAREQSHRVQDTAAAVEEMNATILEVARKWGQFRKAPM